MYKDYQARLLQLFPSQQVQQEKESDSSSSASTADVAQTTLEEPHLHGMMMSNLMQIQAAGQQTDTEATLTQADAKTEEVGQEVQAKGDWQEKVDTNTVVSESIQLKGASYAAGDSVQVPESELQQHDSNSSATEVQLAAKGEKASESQIQQVAATGFSRSSTSLPHLNQIQQSFGVDLSGVQAYIGGGAATACQQMGAAAYASGNQIAFKEQPSLELAAHEAAHVVQQASGKVQLAGGVGQVGDEYENHADAVAAKVAMGESAVPLLAEYAKSPSPSKSLQGSIQMRGLTNQEQFFMTRLERFADEARKEVEPYSGPKFADNTLKAKKNLLNQIGSVPRGTSDPDHLMATLWSLHVWATDPSSYSKAKAIPNYGENVREFRANDYKCNRFVGDAYAIGAKAGYAPHGRGGHFPTGVSQIAFDVRPGYPVSANELISDDPARGSLTNLPLTQTPQTGDIISFELGPIDHTGINLGNNIYISARYSERRPVWSMQPQDGVQITEVPSKIKYNYREFQPPVKPRDYTPPYNPFGPNITP